METEDIDKILGKSYADLTPSERETIQEICGSEEEFLQLQQFFASVENYAQETQEDFPSAQTKDRLDDLFHETYQSKGILWYNSLWSALYPTEKRFDQRPLVRIAAILVVLISIIPFLDNPRMEQKSLAKNEPVQKEEESAISSGSKEKTFKAESPDAKAPGAVLVDKSLPMNENISTFDVSTTLKDAAMEDAAMEEKSVTPTKYAETFSLNASPASATTSYSWSSNAGYVHPDGIYMDTFTYESDAFTTKQSLAVLDLLTPAF